jgi:hypothetical protein
MIEFLLCVISICCCEIFVIATRNKKTCKLFREINNLCYEYNIRHLYADGVGSYESAWDWCYDKLPSYNSIMHSFKPLTIEAWLTKEQINKLKS